MKMEFTNIENKNENTPITEIIENPEIKTDTPEIKNETPEIKSDSTIEQKPKKTRGRPKKSENETEIKTEKTEKVKIDSEKGKSDLKSFLNDFKTETPTSQQPTSEGIVNNPSVTPVISGYMLLLICDFVFPSVIVLVIGKLSKNLKKKIVAKNLKLTKEEKKELEPLANEAVKYMFSDMHPLTAFAVSLGSIYIGKTFEQLD
jgi:hypothetical protein